MTIERRVYATEFRDVPGSKGRQKWATAVRYNIVDSWGTIWLPGCFDKALEQRMPTMLYGHDRYTLEHVLGKGVAYRQTPPDVGPPGVDVLLEFDDPEFVPMSRQAMWQVDNKTLNDVSVGFDRIEWNDRPKLSADQLHTGAREAMIEAIMDDLSIVVRGAVPGAQFAMRAAGQVPLDAVVDIARRKVAGELTDDEAKAALDLLTVESEAPAGTTEETGEQQDGPTAEEITAAADALDADIDAALAERSR